MENNNPQPMVSFSQPDDPEAKVYLILIIGNDENGDEFKDFEFKTGRTAAYEYIKSLVQNIDLIQSKIIVESQTILQSKSVLKFMRYVVDEGLIDDSGFDIMDYVIGDYVEEEE